MEILLWLLPAALVTALAAWGAGVAARRDEAARTAREDEAVAGETRPGRAAAHDAPSWEDLEADDGVSAPRPARRPLDPAPRQQDGQHGGQQDGQQGGQRPVRRSA